MPGAKLRAGLYGAGAFGRFILHSLRDSEHVAVVAIANRTYERGVSVAAEFGVETVHRTYESLLGDRNVDAVIIATPPADHGPAALAALAAGKHAFVEKPLALGLEIAERIIDLAAARHLRVAIDYPMIYTPLVQAMTLFRTARLAGPLLRIAVENIASSQGLHDDHWFWNGSLSGGIFIEHGVHFFDWCGALLEEPESVSAVATTNGVREDRVFAAVKHVDGALATYFHAFVTTPANERTRTSIAFESLDVILEGWIPTVLRLSGPASVVATTTLRRMLDRSVESVPNGQAGFIFDAGPKQAAYERGVRAAVADFAHGVRDPGYVPLNDVTRAYRSLRVAVAARDAAASGSTQSIATVSQIPARS